MKTKLLLGTLLLAHLGNAQTDSYTLEQNNVSATIRNGGVFFNDPDLNQPGYEVPKGSGNHLIYAMSFWYAGEDVGGQLKGSLPTYIEETDAWPGALTNTGTASALTPPENAEIYPVTKAQIDYHIANYSSATYTVPDAIADWPAHGDVSLGLDFYLAPFVDVDGDGIYTPSAGDYPKIKGDEAVYLILNDKVDVHGSAADPIGMEVHYLFYQFNDDPNNTTYLNVRFINRSTQTLYGFRSGCFVDCDLGAGDDDFVGFDEATNTMFAYNGSNTDADYGTNPPALGITLLNHDAYAFAAYGSAGPTALPATPLQFYNSMDARWNDGSHFTEGGIGYGGSTETNFIYNGNPNNLAEWSEVSEGNLSGDRRMMMSVATDVLSPWEILCFDFAIFYNRDGNNLENVQGLLDYAAELKTAYDLETDHYCEQGFVSIEENEAPLEVKIFPNPGNGQFTIELEGNYDLNIFSIDGRLLQHEVNLNNQSFIETELTTGTYVLQVIQGDRTMNKKLVVH